MITTNTNNRYLERKLDGARARFRTIRIGRGGPVGVVNFSGAE